MIVPRLVLGTARIAGGIDERRGIALVRCALDRGVGHIDTAPSYGMGTAEVVVGKAIHGYDHARITAKLGSQRPGQPWLRTALRRIKRGIGTPKTTTVAYPPAIIDARTGNDFSQAAMAQSLALSRDRLGRIDLLLVHDISAPEVSPGILGSVEAFARQSAAMSGYASYARWDPAIDALFPATWNCQCAPDPLWLTGARAAPTDRPLWLHSVAKTGLALASGNPKFSAALEQAAAMVEARDRQTARLAALYALAAERIPYARLLVTSSHIDRLDSLLSAITKIDLANQGSDIAGRFASQAG